MAKNNVQKVSQVETEFKEKMVALNRVAKVTKGGRCRHCLYTLSATSTNG